MMKLPGLTVVVLAISLAIGCTGEQKNHIVLSGTIESDTVHAGSRIGGRIRTVMFEEGQIIKQGDTLLTLETDVLTAQKDQLDATINEAEAAYNVLVSGAKPDDIAQAEQQAEALRQAWELAKKGPLPEEVSAAEKQAEAVHATYKNAQDAADRLAKLFNEGVVAERDYIAARQSAETAKKQWEASKNHVEALKGRPRPEEIAAAKARYLAATDLVKSMKAGATKEQLASGQARVDTSKKALERLILDLGETTVTAPATGLLNSFSLKPGDFIAPGQQVGEIVDMTDLKVKVYVPENYLGYIREGVEVPIVVDSYPGKAFTGSIKSVAAEAEFTPRNVQTVGERVSQVFAVTIKVPNPDGLLRPGMAADVSIYIKK